MKDLTVGEAVEKSDIPAARMIGVALVSACIDAGIAYLRELPDHSALELMAYPFCFDNFMVILGNALLEENGMPQIPFGRQCDDLCA